MTDFVHDVVDDKFFSVLEGPFGNVKAALRGVGAASFIGSNFGFGFDWESEEFCCEVCNGLNF